MRTRLVRTIALMVVLLTAVALARPALAEDVMPSPSPTPTESPAPTPPPPAPLPDGEYRDIGNSFVESAINYVARWRNWMARYDGTFRPRQALTRRDLAVGLVRAFAPLEVRDAAVSFSDLSASNSFERYANIAVSHRWMFPTGGKFYPTAGVTKREMDRALVRALGLGEVATGLQHMGTADGYEFRKPAFFPYMVLADELHLNYNYHLGYESYDLYPWDLVPREYLAYGLMQAARQGDWVMWSVQGYSNITLPTMSPARRRIVEFALQYTGYPYVYAGEWYRSGHGQTQGGFDCSGLQWWVTQRSSDGYPVADVRKYYGWQLGARRASLIAKVAPSNRKVWGWKGLKPADLIFFDADGDDSNYRNIDHGGIYLGNGWFLHSSGSRAGVTMGYLGDGSWWQDSYVMGRRLFD